MEEEFVEYWVWLQQALGANSPKPERLLEEFGSIEKIYNARRVDYINKGFLNEKEIRRLCDKSLDKSKEIVGKCMENGYNIIALPDLPQRLRNIYAPPCVLYVWGSLPEPTDGIYISMVGTREVTPYGVEAATKLSIGLVRCGAVVVSGLALGVDAAAHKGALKGGGKTVAVIGCGIDIEYPVQNKELKRLIAQNGAVVSEYPPGTQPSRRSFPIRNRIIAGLSLGCVVVEAGTRSGALITASLATEMGRDVFAVPGSIFSPASSGTNKLLRDGAKPVCNVLDILEEYIGLFTPDIVMRMSREKSDNAPQLSFDNMQKGQSAKRQPKKPAAVKSGGTEKSEKPKKTEKPEKTEDKKPALPREEKAKLQKGGTNGLSERQNKVLSVLTKQPQHVDDIAVKANLELRVVLAVLTTLEIEGYVSSYPGKRYTLTE